MNVLTIILRFVHLSLFENLVLKFEIILGAFRSSFRENVSFYEILSESSNQISEVLATKWSAFVTFQGMLVLKGDFSRLRS